MKRYKVIKTYLTDKGQGLEKNRESDEIETFSAETEKDALVYFRHMYKTNIRLCTKAHYLKKEVSTYELQTYPKNGRTPKHIDSEMIYT